MLKKSKEPPSNYTKTLQIRTDKSRTKEHQLVTAGLRNWQFRDSMIFSFAIKHWR